MALSSYDAEKLLEMLGKDFHKIEQESNKIIQFLDGEAFSFEKVLPILSIEKEYNIFTLIDQFLEQEKPAILLEYLQQNPNDIPVILYNLADSLFLLSKIASLLEKDQIDDRASYTHFKTSFPKIQAYFRGKGGRPLHPYPVYLKIKIAKKHPLSFWLKKLNEIALEKSVDDLFGNRPVLKKRFGYHEILLRARAMECFINNESWNLQEVEVENPEILGKSKKKYNGRLNSVILDYLKEFRNSESETKNLSAFLNDAIKKVEIVFADNAFKRVGGEKSTSINKTIAELQLVVLSKFDLKMVVNNKEKIRDSFVEFIDNSDENMFIRGTNNTKNVEKRYEWGRVVSDILREA